MLDTNGQLELPGGLGITVRLQGYAAEDRSVAIITLCRRGAGNTCAHPGSQPGAALAGGAGGSGGRASAGALDASSSSKVWQGPEAVRFRSSAAPGYCLAVCDTEPGETPCLCRHRGCKGPGV